jgi:hypothetical protein
MQFISVRRTEGVQGSTVRRDLACLFSILQLAKAKGWLRKNPVQDLDLSVIEQASSRTRYLSKAEEDRLIAHAADYLKPIIIFAMKRA